MTQLFHAKVGIPEPLHAALPYPRLRYSRHALDEARNDHLSSLPTVLPTMFDVVEIETLCGIANKWTLCIHAQYYDLFMVVMRDGFVKTVWTFEPNETKPLQLDRYDKPEHYFSRRAA